MLFQETSLPNTGVRGFILDLDPVECPMSMAAVPDWCRDQGSVRLAAYDLIASPTPPTHQTVYPRYALESLFHILVWFYASTEFAKGGGLVPRAPPYSWYNEWFRPGIQMHLPIDRTEHQYKEFLEGRRGFLADREHRTFEGSESRMAGMRKLHDDWVMPLWTLVREAQFFARWRDGECDFDWETLGGRFTVDNFMEILAPARSGAA
ncbi:hypothetical protein C8R44DRAFT_257261 [Mycena epipterygia]|nr:hypothetical protein C8R44DRAFT_257261 [Mycena epipterygia]